MGYGDLFVAALLGAVLARNVRQQRAAAVLTLAIAAVFDLLFLVINELPATVPVALALIVVEGWQWERGRRQRAGTRERPGDGEGEGEGEGDGRRKHPIAEPARTRVL
jgi:type III secretory pathway component EscV